MSNGSDAAEDYLSELYGNEDEPELDEAGDTKEEEDLSDEEFHLPSSRDRMSSPATSSSSQQGSPVYRDRSRSPLWDRRQSEPLPTEEGVVIKIFDDEAESVYITPDEHVVYDYSDYIETVIDESESGAIEDEDMKDSVRGKSGKGRLRGRSVKGSRRGQRGRGLGVRCRSEDNQKWEIGHPIEEIWTTDEDVPTELREMARDVLRRRQLSKQARARERKIMVEEYDSMSEEEDEFMDANDGEVSPQLEWSPMKTYRIEPETFRPERTGAVSCYSTPYDAFRSYWDDSILKSIVDETNRYALTVKSPSFQTDWYPTNLHEIMCLFAFWMMLGIIRMPTIVSCFSTNPLLKTDIFRHIFTFRRHSNLVRALNFVHIDPSNSTAGSSTSHTAGSDLLQALRPIITHLNAKFQANYTPSQDICIDESVILWKGRGNIKEFIRSNREIKYGIKSFELCESATGYLWSFLVSGKHSSFELGQDSSVLKSSAVVKKLITPLLNKGYRLFVDNRYNSPHLARFLKHNGTDCVGTLDSSHQDVPPIFERAPLKQGQMVARHTGAVCVLSWQERKRITMVSTCHGTAIGLQTVPSRPGNRPPAFKPQAVLDYNKSIGGVDLKDQLLEPYLLERKRCVKWYMKLFKRLLNCSILNARTLQQSSVEHTIDHFQFRLELVYSILSNHLSDCPKSRRATTAVASVQNPTRYLNHAHWLVRIPPSATKLATNRKGQARCVVCLAENRKNKRSPFKCQTCDVALCVENCFRIYHTKV